MLKLLCLFSLLVCQDAQGNFIFPLIMEHNERIAHKSDISCELPIPVPDDKKLKAHNFISMTPIPQPILVNGFLCRKELWIKTCHENFLGQQSITYVTQSSRVTSVECQRELELLNIGRREEPKEPVENCQWMKDINVTVEVIDLIPHNVYLDHYSLSYRDPLFKTSNCYQEICNTVDDDLIWLAKEKTLPSCPNSQTDSITIFADEINPSLSTSYVKSAFIQSESLKDACRGLHYCGSSYLVLKSGHGIKLDNIPSTLSELHKNLPECGNVDIITENDSAKEIAYGDQILEYMHMEACMEVISRLEDDGLINLWDLSKLSPLYPGVGRGFYILNSTLMTSNFNYVIMKKINKVKKIKDWDYSLSYIDIHGIETNILLRCNERFTKNGDEICTWVNGIIIKNERIFLPAQSVEDHLLRDKLFERSSLQVDKHLHINTLRHHKIPISTESFEENFRNLWEETLSLSSHWWKYLVILVLLIIILISFCLCCPIFKIRDLLTRLCPSFKSGNNWKSRIVRYSKDGNMVEMI